MNMRVITLDGAIILNPRDTVATATVNLGAGKQMQYMIEGVQQGLSVVQDIPAGHKFALHDIHPAEHVYKYGEIIGRALVEIRSGEHVHVHNVESLRGRGEWS